MGLFSFVKNAGAKLFNKKKKTAPKKEEEKVDPQAENKAKAAELRKEIEKWGFKVDYLNVSVDDDKATVSGIVDSQTIREKVILVVGNVTGIATVDDQLEVAGEEEEVKSRDADAEVVEEEEEAKAGTVFYTVVKGDYLSKIAKEHYGSGSKYPVIFEANKPMLTHPDLIYPGQVLRIPPLSLAAAPVEEVENEEETATANDNPPI